MGFGGIIAGAIGQGAQNVSDLAQQQIDVNNKQQLASFQSGLEADRQAQAARLQQTIGRENSAFAASPEGLAQSGAVTTNTIATTAAANADPATLANNAAAEAAKPRELGPGQQYHQTVNGVDTVLASNDKPTQADAWMAGMHTGGKAANFSAKEIDDGLTSTTTAVEKSYADPATTKTPPALLNIGAQAYGAAVSAGQTPAQARIAALTRVDNAWQSAQWVMQQDQYKDQVKGDFNAALRVAQQLKSASPAPTGAGTPPVGASTTPANTPPATMGNSENVPGADADQPGLLMGAMSPTVAQGTSLDARRASQAARNVAAATAPGTAPTPAAAQAAFAAVNGDPQAASQLQDSPMFAMLNTAQQAAIFKIVNGKP